MFEWDGESNRPGWTCQSEFVPCDGGMCYFVLNILNGGIGHKENNSLMVEYSCGTCVDTTGSKNERVIFIGKSLSCFRMCYRNQPGNLKSK